MSIEKRTQKECDALLSPLIKKLHPSCLLCGAKTQVAHHHYHKSKSLSLRYNIDNLIPLCNGCHFKLGFNESYWGCKILQIKGMKWFNKLESRHDPTFKPNYDLIYKTLKKYD